MPTDANAELLQKILQDLNSHIDGIEQIVVIRKDGTLLAQLDSSGHTEKTEAILTEFATLTDGVCGVLDRGANTEAIVKGKHRFLALYRTRGAHTSLGVVGQASVNLGLLNSGSRIAIEKIESIVAD